MAAFILRMKEAPELQMWKAFRERCLAEGRSQRWVILELVRRYIEKGLD